MHNDKKVMNSQHLANLIMEFEQKNLPYFNVSEIEIIYSDNHMAIYNIKISSKIDPKWSKWESSNEIDLSKLITQLRDEKINLILED